MGRNNLIAAALCGGLAVLLGAFGAHVLRPILPLQKMTIFETAVRYQMWHALALLALAVLQQHGGLAAPRLLGWSGRLFLAGILLFSGSLYGVVFLDRFWLGAVTPVGGVSWVAAWALLGMAAWRSRLQDG